MTHDIHAQNAVEHRKPIIPEDIQEKAREVLKACVTTGFSETQRHSLEIVIAGAMAMERYRCVDIIEQFDPEIAARLWSDK